MLGIKFAVKLLLIFSYITISKAKLVRTLFSASRDPHLLFTSDLARLLYVFVCLFVVVAVLFLCFLLREICLYPVTK